MQFCMLTAYTWQCTMPKDPTQIHRSILKYVWRNEVGSCGIFYHLALTCAGVWMTATLSKVTIPSNLSGHPGRLSTFHPSCDLSVVWQSTRVWWGSMVGELASTKLVMQMIAIVKIGIYFNNTSSEPQYCLVLLHFDKLAWFEQLETDRSHPYHGWTPRVCCWSLAGSSCIEHKNLFTKFKTKSLLQFDILCRFL